MSLAAPRIKECIVTCVSLRLFFGSLLSGEIVRFRLLGGVGDRTDWAIKYMYQHIFYNPCLSDHPPTPPSTMVLVEWRGEPG